MHLLVDSKKKAPASVAGTQEKKSHPSSTSDPLGIRSKQRAEDESAGLVAQRREQKASN